MEVVIKHNVILRTNMTCLQVTNESNERRVLSQEPHELPKAGALIEFWNLLAVLKLRIQNINWAAPHVSTKEVLMDRFCLGQQLERGKACSAIRQTIVHPYSMLDSKWPQLLDARSPLLSPTKTNVNHVSLSH